MQLTFLLVSCTFLSINIFDSYALSMFFGNTRFRITASRKTTATQLSANTVRTISGKILNMPVADVKPRPTLSERLTMTMLR